MLSQQMATPKTQSNDMSCKEKKNIVAKKIIIGKGRLAECGDPTLQASTKYDRP